MAVSPNMRAVKAASGSTAQSQPDVQTPNLESKKILARQLMEAMDEASLRRLAGMLQSRGLICEQGGRLQTVPRHEAVGFSREDLAAKQYVHASPRLLNADIHTAAPNSATPFAAAVTSSSVETEAAAVDLPPTVHHADHFLQHAAPGTAEAQAASAAEKSGKEARILKGAAAQRTCQRHEKADDGMFATLVIQDVQSGLDKKGFEKWIDDNGFKGLYTILQWSPGKDTSRNSALSRAVISFPSAKHAQTFQQVINATHFGN